jgi:hypothetical protein
MMRRHPILCVLLVALLATRALVPTGWMPVAGADGVRITLCTGQGLVVATLDADGDILPMDPSEDAPRETCPFATFAHSADLPPMPLVAAAPIEHAAPPLPAAAPLLAATLHAPRPPTRGPPTHA